MKQTKKLLEEILAKQELLNQAKIQLKKEFVGIDQVIDEVINSVSSWFLFPDMQEKPVVVNLWGLTGTGKSSLVNRLATLLQQEKRYYQFDLGANERERSLKDNVENIYENENGFPIILAFDEFQHAKTIDEVGKEINKSDSRIIWELLDSGRFQITRNNLFLEEIFDLIYKLRFFLRKGLRTSKGLVLSQKEYFIKEMDLEREYRDNHFEGPLNLKKVKIVPVEFYDKIFDLVKDLYKTPFEVKAELMQLNGYETIEFLNKVFEHATSPKTVDCSKAIIFVLGNLDEAYTMSRNYNPDMSADEFHELSLKINVPQIKSALKGRFRNEQIARLGNTHIIYPAFSCDSFKKIIDLELNKITKKVYEHQNITLEFDSSIKKLIYKEGVYPTQGTRPIFTTIHHIVKTKFARIITEMIIHRIKADKVKFTFDGSFISMFYLQNGESVHRIKEKQVLKLEELRVCKKDDMQTITAVHESGHAIISSVLLRTVPEVIFSNTTETANAGFVYTKFKWNYVSRKEILNRLAMFLGGYFAEKIVFGKENITTGSDEDIQKATGFITEMLKNCGMGLLPASYQIKDFRTNYNLHDVSDNLNNEAEQWLKSAMELAEKTLKEQEVLLLKMADYLSDKRTMTKEMITEMLQEYALNFKINSLIEDGDHLFYRKHLKTKVQAIETGNKRHVEAGIGGFSLNKKT